VVAMTDTRVNEPEAVEPWNVAASLVIYSALILSVLKVNQRFR
jgi:hypothetical protein